MRTVPGSTSPVNIRALLTVFLTVLLAICFQIMVMGEADARKRKRYKKYKRSHITKRVRANRKYAAIVIDAKTGKVLHSRNANARRYPASLTKMMTLYLVFEDLKSGRISKKSRLVMTKAGARRPPSKLGLRVGRSISMQQAILALVTKSANDVSTAIGDKLSGSEAKFAKRMTLKARQLGMMRTTFKNANGLTAKGQTTTAADMAKLGLALREHFPRYYKYFSTRQFRFGKRRYGNHNKLLGRVRGVDGIKTGYTRASGFNLVSSVSSRDRRIVAVVMGGRSGRSRNAQMRKLIKRYLPKASRGGSRRLVARAKSSLTGGARVVATAKAPAKVIRAKVKVASRVASAHAVPVPATKDVERVRDSLLSMAASETPKPSLRAIDQVVIEKIITASVSSAPRPKLEVPIVNNPIKIAGDTHVDGWQIQIAATDSHESALEMLDKVQSKNKRLLKKADPRAYRVEIGDSTFYRARFTGFSSKTAARRACKIIKRQRTACLALNG